MHVRRVNVRLAIDQGRPDIDVLVTAPVRDEQVEALMTRIEDPLAGTLAVFDGEGESVLLDEGAVISISTDNKKLRVNTEEGVYLLRDSLQNVECRLNSSAFLRVSRYEIINLSKVRRFDFSVVGALRIAMADGSDVWASRRYIRTIKNRLQEKGWTA